MALIKGKQIQSLVAAKIVESPERQFATAVEKASYAAKAEVHEVETAVSTAKQALTEAIAAEKVATTEAIAAEKVATAEKITLVEASIATVDGKVATNAGAITVGLGERYTKDEVDSKMAQLASGILYKGTVGTFDEIAVKYPVPVQGWLVAVDDSNKFYVFSDTEGWEEFPIEVEACTTHSKNIALSVTDNQTVIKTGIRTDGVGALQTSTVLAQEITMIVNGYAQTKGIDYTVAIVGGEIEITWLVVDFALEQSDAISITYNQTV